MASSSLCSVGDRSTDMRPPIRLLHICAEPLRECAGVVILGHERWAMADFVAAVDQGTTSTRLMIFDHEARVVGRHQLEHEQILPRAGWVEHDPLEIRERTTAVIEIALDRAGLAASDLAAVGITNQR